MIINPQFLWHCYLIFYQQFLLLQFPIDDKIFPESDTEGNVLRESFTERYFYGISKSLDVIGNEGTNACICY